MGVLGDSTTTTIRYTNNPEAPAGLDLIEDAGLIDNYPTDETVIVQATGAALIMVAVFGGFASGRLVMLQ